jgi:hypothetical protein
MDKLDRRLIQLQIEREAVSSREKDEASQKRFGLIERRNHQAAEGNLRPRRDLAG